MDPRGPVRAEPPRRAPPRAVPHQRGSAAAPPHEPGALGALLAWPPLVGAINLRTDPEQRELNRRSATPADYDLPIDEILDAGQPSGVVRALTDREHDSAVGLTTRTRAGHGGERPTATGHRFDEIVPRLFFAVFAALEDLYA